MTVNRETELHNMADTSDTLEPATAGEAGKDGAGQPQDFPRPHERRAPQPAQGAKRRVRRLPQLRAGDDLRFVDWNTYARLERLFLKMFLEEEDLHFYALIDASSSMDFGEPTKLPTPCSWRPPWGSSAWCRGDRVKIETLGQPAGRPAPVFRGRRSLWRMLELPGRHRARPERPRWPRA